jgi:hypothetical protein
VGSSSDTPLALAFSMKEVARSNLSSSTSDAPTLKPYRRWRSYHLQEAKCLPSPKVTQWHQSLKTLLNLPQWQQMAYLDLRLLRPGSPTLDPIAEKPSFLFRTTNH